MDEQKTIPLSVMVENVKTKTTESISKIMQESNLPAFLMEGIVVGILSDIRNQKNMELVSDYNSMNQMKEKEGGKDGEN